MSLNNIIISIMLIFTIYAMIILAFRFFGKIGLLFCIPVVIIIANIQVILTISFLTFTLTLGNAAYTSSYLITDILGEMYGKKTAQQGVIIGFFAMLAFMIIMNITLLFEPFGDDFSIQALDSATFIFGLLPRLAIASIISYLVSQSLDVLIFSKIKKKTKGKALWLRNNMSTVTSQLIDGVVFTLLAFTGVYEINIVFEIFISTYIVKFLISILDTPFMYLANYLFKKNKIREITDLD